MDADGTYKDRRRGEFRPTPVPVAPGPDKNAVNLSLPYG